jgi:hypothetical protein
MKRTGFPEVQRYQSRSCGVSNHEFLEHERKHASKEESAAIFVSSCKNTKTPERAENLDDCEKVLHAESWVNFHRLK